MKKIVLTYGVYERRQEVISAVKEYFQQHGWTVIVPNRDYAGMMSVIQHDHDYMRKIEEFKRLASHMHKDGMSDSDLIAQTKDDKTLILFGSGICDLYAYANLDPMLDERWFTAELLEKCQDLHYDAVFQLLSYPGMEALEHQQPVSLEKIQEIETKTAKIWKESGVNFTQVKMNDFELNYCALISAIAEALKD